MKAAFKQPTKAYFFSAWLPASVALFVFGLLFINELKLHVPYISWTLLLGLGGILLSVLAAGIIQIIKGRTVSGAINLMAFPLIGYVVFQGMSFLFLRELFNDEPDNFGKNIVIPADMKVGDPVENFEEPGQPVTDGLTAEVITAFAASNYPAASPRVSTDFSILNDFATTNRQRLIQYLAGAPQWFVTEENGKSYAYRRLKINGRWENTLNGYYGNFELPTKIPFQMRIIIGFDGPVFVEPFSRKKVLTTAQIGSGDVPIRVVDDKEYNQGKESYLLLQSGKAVIEIFEQSRLDARPATQLALAEVKHELETALVVRDGGMLHRSSEVLPDQPGIEVAKGMQGGIYKVRAFVNPGEAGRTYIKVFEATQNTPLSATRIKPVSISRIGWSTNSTEKYRYQSEITVYEGDWGTFYPGRFELWFIPDSGGSERKLVDRIFRIEGWQR